MHVRKNDQVMVITGKDKSTKGKFTVAFPKTGKVIVEGVNMVTRHQKARNAMQPGGIVKKEAAIDASNVMLICPEVRQAHPRFPQGERGCGCQRQEEPHDGPRLQEVRRRY